MTHHVDAASLVAMAAALYGGAPEVRVVGVGPGSLDVGEGLTAVVEGAVPQVIEAVLGLVGAAGG